MKFVTAFAVGGTERHFVNLAFALDRSRFAVHFGCLRRWGQLLELVDARGIPVFDYRVSRFRSLNAFGAQVRLARDIKKHRIDIVHTYNFDANVFAIPVAKLAGARVVASIRDMGAYLSARQRRFQKYACMLADRILVNAQAIKDWLVADGYDAARIEVIPNGIDVARFTRAANGSRLRAEFGLPHDAPLVGLVGRIAPLKGVEDFLSAAATLAPRFPAARFIVVGDEFGPGQRPRNTDDTYMSRLMRRAAELQIQERVVFTGYRSDVDAILPQLSIAVQPSLSEGLSNALLEPMAASLPVVATRVGGTGEAVRDGETGLLVAPSEPDAIASAVGRLLASPDLAARIGRAARQSIADNYSMTRMVERTSAAYENLHA